MFEFEGQAYELICDFQCDNFDLHRYCELGVSPLPELTEEKLQQLEQRAEDWYMSMM